MMKSIPIKGFQQIFISETGNTLMYPINKYKIIQFYRQETSKGIPEKVKFRSYISILNIQTRQTKLTTMARLVYATYNGKLKKGYVIDHIDNNQTNDHYTNLQQITIQENALKRKNDNKIVYQQHKLQKDIEKQKKKDKHKIICEETGKIYSSKSQCAKEFNITKQAIGHAVKNHSLVQKKYHFKKFL